MAAQSTCTAQGASPSAARKPASPAAPARVIQRATPHFADPEVESILAEAVQAGKVAGPLVDVWRDIGEADVMQLQMLANFTPSAKGLQEIERMATRHLANIDRTRHLLTALKLAAEQDARHPGEAELYWPSLLEVVQDLIPDDDRLEDALSKTIRSMQMLSAGAVQYAARQASQQAARGRKTDRRAAVASARQPAL